VKNKFYIEEIHRTKFNPKNFKFTIKKKVKTSSLLWMYLLRISTPKIAVTTGLKNYISNIPLVGTWKIYSIKGFFLYL